MTITSIQENIFFIYGKGPLCGPGSEGSKGSKGGGGGWRRRLGPTTSAGCVEGGDGPSGRGLWHRRFAAISIKSALRDCLPAIIVILSRRRRISVPDEYEAIGIHAGVWYLKHTSHRLVFSSTPLTYYSYRDPSLRSVFWSYVKSFS